MTPVHALERRWPKRGEHAPFCDGPNCHRRARYVYFVGVHDVNAFCQLHGDEAIKAAKERGKTL